MADDNELTLKDPAAAKKKKLIMIVALVVLLLGGGGAGAWFMFAGSDAPAAEEAEAKPDANTPKPSLYVGMPRPFVFNVAGGSGIGWCRSRSSCWCGAAPTRPWPNRIFP